MLPALTLQAGSLYASGDASTFTGTGGPWGFDPFTSQFAGSVSSAGLANEPFADTVYGVSTGDEVTFVIAVQNLAAGASAYDVRLRAGMPTGFVTPPEGAGITVTNGAGTDLATSGDLFSAAGLSIATPIRGYDPNSGLNVALITYTLIAGPTLPGPSVSLGSTATLVHAAAASGGVDLSGSHPATATTTVVSASPTPVVVAETDPSAVATGQTISFDVTTEIPRGTIQDLRLDEVAQPGTATLTNISAAIISIGGSIQGGTPVFEPNGSIAFGAVTNPVGASPSGGDAIVVRITAQAAGTITGPATLDTVLSAVDPSKPGARFTADVASTVGVVVLPPPPGITGLRTNQHATPTITLHPFGAVQLTAASAQSGTLAITLQDGTLGRLSAGALGSVDAAGDAFVATGSIADLQQAARQLVFTPSQPGANQPGTAQLTITLADAAGGVAQDQSSSITIAPSIDTGSVAQHFAPIPAETFLTATADGQETIVGGEAYNGPVSYLQSQYIYDGPLPVAIIAQSPNVFVKSFVGNAAVEVQSGQNVIDAGKGSNFLVGGTGLDVFFLDGRSEAVTWDTIVGFHPGDIATVFGYDPAVSSFHWDDNAGATGNTGRTLRFDLNATGQTTDSLTFAGTNQATTNGYALTTGQIGGIDYMTIFAL